MALNERLLINEWLFMTGWWFSEYFAPKIYRVFFSSPNAEKSGRISMMTSPWRVSGTDDGERIRGITPNQGIFY